MGFRLLKTKTSAFPPRAMQPIPPLIYSEQLAAPAASEVFVALKQMAWDRFLQCALCVLNNGVNVFSGACLEHLASKMHCQKRVEHSMKREASH
jgi:hypothetical protein